MPMQSRIAVSLTALLTGVVDIGKVSHDVAFGPEANFADGAGAGQANKVWTDTRTLAASATENLDLAAGGGLVDAIGTPFGLTKLKGLLIRAAATNANDLIIGGLTAAQFGIMALFGLDGSSARVKPGGFFLVVAPDANGYTVTAATADLLKIANGGAGTGVDYDIVVIGA